MTTTESVRAYTQWRVCDVSHEEVLWRSSAPCWFCGAAGVLSTRIPYIQVGGMVVWKPPGVR